MLLGPLNCIFVILIRINNIYYGYNLNTLTINFTNQLLPVNIKIKPLIYSQPYSQAVLPNTTVIFTIFVLSLSTVTYQWFFNDLPIKGATNSNYVIDKVKKNDVGKYFVIVTNKNGSTQSDNAYLTIINF